MGTYKDYQSFTSNFDFFLFLTKFSLAILLFLEFFFSLKKLFICVILMLYTEFQSPTMYAWNMSKSLCAGVVVGVVGVVGVVV